jgi:predicted RNase H-like nuclease
MGWVVASWDWVGGGVSLGVAADFAGVLALTAGAERVGVDIPIGLLEAAETGGRACDRAARGLLGPRASSVFPPPVRAALETGSYREAVNVNRASSAAGLGISKQCHGLFPRLQEVHRLMTPALQERVREVHPELCFRAMNGGEPLAFGKRTMEGRNQRLRLLEGAGFARPHRHLAVFARSAVAEDDVLDALAAAWTAARLARGEAECVVADPPRDAAGLRMEMWY